MEETKVLENTDLEEKDLYIDEDPNNIEETLFVNNYNEYFLKQALKFIKVSDEEKK